MTMQSHPEHRGSKTHRIVTGAFGVLFVCLAIAILCVADGTLGPIIAALATGALGVDALHSACRNTSSLLFRIGLLP